MAGRKGRTVIGLPVVDAEGIEIGYVSGEDDKALVLGEGTSASLRLGRRFVARVEDKVYLTGPVAEIFAGLNVVDNDGEFVGVVRDTMEAEDTLDGFIVEDEAGEMLTALLEDVGSIDEWIDLNVSGDELEEG